MSWIVLAPLVAAPFALAAVVLGGLMLIAGHYHEKALVAEMKDYSAQMVRLAENQAGWAAINRSLGVMAFETGTCWPAYAWRYPPLRDGETWEPGE